MTLTTPVKVIALAGLALILAAGGVVTLVARPAPSAAPIVVPPVRHAVVKVVKVAAAPKPHVPAKPRIVLDPSLPAPVRQKLMLSRETVAYVYTGASAADRAMLMQVRQGAHAAGVPFVPLNVTDEKLAESVFTWASTTDDPVVLVVRRPGKLEDDLAGLTDSKTVAQAAVSAR